jgi:hypothetical protein
MTYTIAVGNPFDGLTLHGLFNDPEEANQFADLEFKNQDWNVVQIQPRSPETEELR